MSKLAPNHDKQKGTSMPTQNPVSRLSSNLEKLGEQQGQLECAPLMGGGGPFGMSLPTLFLATIVQPAQVGGQRSCLWAWAVLCPLQSVCGPCWAAGGSWVLFVLQQCHKAPWQCCLGCQSQQQGPHPASMQRPTASRGSP